MNRKEWIEGAKIQYHPDWLRRWKQDPFSVPPIYVEISPVGMCNHRCTFCAPEVLGYPNRQLDLPLLRQRLTEMKTMREEDPDGLGIRSIQYAGEGEPTLHKDLAEIFQATRDANIDVGMLTNGTGLTEHLAEGIIPLVNGYIQVSVNGGTAQTHALIHRAPPTHWDIIWRNLGKAVEIKHKLRAAECELGVNSVVLIQDTWDHQQNRMVPANLQEMELLVKKTRDTGLDYVTLKPYTQQPQSLQTAKLYGGMSYKEVLDKIYEMGQDLVARYNSPTFEVILRFKRFKEYEAEDRGYQTCRATPTLWSYIQSDGVWISCSGHWTEEQFHLGNIKNQTVKEIWYGERRREHLKFVLNHLDISVCKKNCHPNEDNQFLDGIAKLPDQEFNNLLVKLESQPKPKRANFI